MKKLAVIILLLVLIFAGYSVGKGEEADSSPPPAHRRVERNSTLSQ